MAVPTDRTLEEKIVELEEDDPVREILEGLLKRIEELEERVAAPPVKPGKRP